MLGYMNESWRRENVGDSFGRGEVRYGYIYLFNDAKPEIPFSSFPAVEEKKKKRQARLRWEVYGGKRLLSP